MYEMIRAQRLNHESKNNMHNLRKNERHFHYKRIRHSIRIALPFAISRLHSDLFDGKHRFPL